MDLENTDSHGDTSENTSACKLQNPVKIAVYNTSNGKKLGTSGGRRRLLCRFSGCTTHARTSGLCARHFTSQHCDSGLPALEREQEAAAPCVDVFVSTTIPCAGISIELRDGKKFKRCGGRTRRLCDAWECTTIGSIGQAKRLCKKHSKQPEESVLVIRPPDVSLMDGTLEPVDTDATLSINHEDSDFNMESFLRESRPTFPSIAEYEDEGMSVEEQEPPATEIFTYSMLRSGLSLVSLPSEWNIFMDDEDFVMFFRIDKASYEITHAVNVAADLVPTIRIHNLLYSGNEFGHIPLENFWSLKELLLSLSYATICPGLQSTSIRSNFDGGCALVNRNCAALCPACKVRRRLTDQRARNNAAKESKEDDSEVRKYSRRKKRRIEQSCDMENLEFCIPNGEVGSPNNGIQSDENTGPPLEPPKRRRRSAKTTKSPKNLTENSLPVDPVSGMSEELHALDNVPFDEAEDASSTRVDTSEFLAPVPIERLGNTAHNQQNESYRSAQKDKKALKKLLKKTCLVCGFVADPPKTGLTMHIRRAHPECAAQWTVECVYCGRKCPSETSLKIHVKAMHKDGLVSAAPDPAAVEAAVEHMKTTGRFTYYCAACHRHYISQAIFDLHQFQHSPPDTSSDHSQRDCPACDFQAPTFPDLAAHTAQHAMRHRGKKPCLICGKYSIDQRAHVRNWHPEEMLRIEADWAEQCEECGEKFKWKRMLGFHKRTAHDGYQCLYCAKLYYKSKEFGDHALEHKIDGLFPCLGCDKKFGAYPLMANHYRSYHDITRAQFCTICRKAVAGGEKQMAAHTRCCITGSSPQPRQTWQRGKYKEMQATVMARYKDAARGQRLPCDQCGQLFVSAVSMLKHIRWVHIGDVKERFEKVREEKRKRGIYVYSRPGYVKPRARIALEDFPYRCDECQLGLIKEISLIKHRDTRHPETCAES